MRSLRSILKHASQSSHSAALSSPTVPSRTTGFKELDPNQEAGRPGTSKRKCRVLDRSNCSVCNGSAGGQRRGLHVLIKHAGNSNTRYVFRAKRELLANSELFTTCVLDETQEFFAEHFGVAKCTTSSAIYL